MTTQQRDLLIHPNRLGPDEVGEIISVNPQRVGWQYIRFDVHTFRPGDKLSAEADDDERGRDPQLLRARVPRQG